VHLSVHAARAPDRPAAVMGAGEDVISYRELDERSNRLAHLLRARGLGRGDVVAIFLENHPRYLEVAWAAQRSGMYFTTVNSHLTVEEAAYIVDDAGAAAVVSSPALHEVAAGFDADRCPNLSVRLMVDDAVAGWDRYQDTVADQPATPLPDECEGDFMLYSSGTTGRPKGIQRPLSFAPMGEGLLGAVPFLQAIGFAEGDTYLCPAPLYHSAPMGWSMGTHRLGGTVVVMERFDPEQALALIERERVTHAQFVPTMFVRMLKLPRDVRERYDLSSLKTIVHAAAPCPVEVKRQMIEWWGPIISEYYSSTEGVGATFITAEEWLAHQGSVGRSMLGEPHILDDDGNELPTGEVGTIWFDGGLSFEYHNDPEKTASVVNEKGWRTVGDMGRVDEDGYLYLTDRKAFMIISGGVNIYPQEAEDVLVTHPKVLDVAVFGVPDPEMGEQVKAAVQPIDWADAGPELESELLDCCRERLSSYKCPRSIDFHRALPRLETGKLYKRVLRDAYWS
jgi:acyl-CoA synthetase (AMP-forming)/AMP-acid ligase II